MEKTAAISAAKLQAKIGRTIDVIIDLADGEGGATGRSKADAPEIDGEVHLRDAHGVGQGDIVRVLVEDADEHDLYGVPLAFPAAASRPGCGGPVYGSGNIRVREASIPTARKRVVEGNRG